MTRFIAEIGSNHNRDLDRCLRLVEAAAGAGAGAAKIQVFRIEDLFSPEALAQRPELRERSAWEFPLEFLPPLRERCRAAGIALGATPFSLDLVGEVAPYCDFLKVASYELLWHDLLRACADTGLPLVVSTGMATLDEVAAAVDAVGGRVPLTLLHCVSGYPTPVEQCNLRAIETLRDEFGVPAGWSDHSGREDVVVRAARHWGAAEVELHVDLDGGGLEAGEHCWLPGELERTIAATAPAGTAGADGDGVKRPQPVEAHDVPWRADPSDGLRPLLGTRRTLAATSA